MDRAGEVAGRGEIARGAEQDAGVPVMAAGVHHARPGGRVGDVVLLRDRQRVHVGAERDRALAAAGAQGAHHAGAGDAAMHLDPELRELGGDEIRGAVFLEAQFRMGVQVVPPGDHVLVQVGDAVVHGLLSARAPILPRARKKITEEAIKFSANARAS